MKTIEKFIPFKLGNVQSKSVLGGGAREDALTNYSGSITICKGDSCTLVTYSYNGYTGEQVVTRQNT
jgi:hypothetical protein